MLFLMLLITFPLISSTTYASTEQRPFWTEQASYTLGDTLYAIGVATKATSVEAGRQTAFTNGLEEIRNYAQVDNLEGLQVATQMTYEEPQSNGTVSIWRLLRVSVEGLRMLKARTRESQKVPEVSRVAVPIAPQRSSTSGRFNFPEGGKEGPAKQADEYVIVKKPELPRATPTLKSANVPVKLPDIPPHVTHVIKGWSRVSAGQLSIDSEERRDWQIPLVKSSELSYRK
jgi:hypothetical protein